MSDKQADQVDLIGFLKIIVKRWKLFVAVFLSAALVIAAGLALSKIHKKRVTVIYTPLYYCANNNVLYTDFVTNEVMYLKTEKGMDINAIVWNAKLDLPQTGALKAEFTTKSADIDGELNAIRDLGDKLFLFYIEKQSEIDMKIFHDQNYRVAGMIDFIETYEGADVPAVSSEEYPELADIYQNAQNGTQLSGNSQGDLQGMFSFLSSLGSANRARVLPALLKIYKKQYEMNDALAQREENIQDILLGNFTNRSMTFDEVFARISNINPAYGNLRVNHDVTMKKPNVMIESLLSLRKLVKILIVSTGVGLVAGLLVVYLIEMFVRVAKD